MVGRFVQPAGEVPQLVRQARRSKKQQGGLSDGIERAQFHVHARRSAPASRGLVSPRRDGLRRHEQRNLAGDVQVKVCTPVVGFDEVWERVLERFVKESGVSDVAIEINDNNATPVVVSMRLRQAIDEARKEAE